MVSLFYSCGFNSETEKAKRKDRGLKCYFNLNTRQIAFDFNHHLRPSQETEDGDASQLEPQTIQYNAFYWSSLRVLLKTNLQHFLGTFARLNDAVYGS